MLSQRAVDCAIKAYALNSPEMCREVFALDDHLCKLELCIGDRGRVLLRTGTMIDSDSKAACSLLRIYGCNRVIFTAATQIAQCTTVLATQDRATTFSRTIEAGDLVNRFFRLCSIALFEEQKTLAETVFRIEGGQREFELALCRARIDLLRRVDTHFKCEMAIVNCLGHIAEQVYEIAGSTIAWIESRERTRTTGAYDSRGLQFKQKIHYRRLEDVDWRHPRLL